MRQREVPQFDISRVLEYYGADLGRVSRSAWSKIRCPFHADSHASASVNLELGRFSCHAGCLDRQTEDAIGLIQFIEHVDYKRASELAGHIAGGTSRTRKPQGNSLLNGDWHE